MGGVGNRPTFRDFENPAAHATTAPLTRWLSIAHYNVLSTLLLVAPAAPAAGTALCVDWSYGAVRLVTLACYLQVLSLSSTYSPLLLFFFPTDFSTCCHAAPHGLRHG